MLCITLEVHSELMLTEGFYTSPTCSCWICKTVSTGFSGHLFFRLTELLLKCNIIYFLPKAISGHWGIVVACICLSVCLSVSVLLSPGCLRHNLSHVCARITKFGLQVQNTSVEVPVGLEVVVCVCMVVGVVGWGWGVVVVVVVVVVVGGGGGGGGGGGWGVPSHNSPVLEPTISKFGPIMHLNPNLIYVGLSNRVNASHLS